MIPESRLTLTREFDEAVLEADRTNAEPASLAEAIAGLWANRNPAMIAVDPDAYRIPSGVALTIYRADLKANRSLPAQSLGRVSSERFWNRMAASARDVFNAKDWSLLGSLAFRADRSASLLQKLRPDENDRLAAQVISAFERLLDPASGMASTTIRVQILYGYLVTIPGSFIIPRELALPTSTASKATTWPLLRRVWATNPEEWRIAPQAVAALLKHPSDFVKDLATGWNKADASKTPVSEKGRDKTGKNPFTGPAQDEGLKRPSAIRVAPVAVPPAVPVRQLPKLFEFTVDELDSDYVPKRQPRPGIWSRFRNRFLAQKRRTYVSNKPRPRSSEGIQ